MTCLSSCNKCLKKIAAAAGIEKKISYHTSRHTFAVLALTAGGDIYTVGKLLGHTSINSTQVYADVVMETKVEAISRISSYFPNNAEMLMDWLNGLALSETVKSCALFCCVIIK